MLERNYTTIYDVMDDLYSIFGEYAKDYDIQAIARECYNWVYGEMIVDFTNVFDVANKYEL